MSAINLRVVNRLRADYADAFRLVLSVQDQGDAHQRSTTLAQAVLAFDDALTDPDLQEALWVLQRAAREPGPPPGTTSVRALLGMHLTDIAALKKGIATQMVDVTPAS